jgi:hypothetical protein
VKGYISTNRVPKLNNFKTLSKPLHSFQTFVNLKVPFCKLK